MRKRKVLLATHEATCTVEVARLEKKKKMPCGKHYRLCLSELTLRVLRESSHRQRVNK